MNWNGEGWTTTGTSAVDPDVLTVEKLEAIMRSIPKPPPMPKYDVYPSAFADKAYEINTSVALAPFADADRRMIVAPPTEAWHWYTELLKLGVDVRWQPRVADQSREQQ